MKTKLARSEKGSSNYRKLEGKMRQLKHRIFNMEQDYYQKLTTDIVRKHGEIKVLKNGRDAKWIRFCHMLYYKSQIHKRDFSII